MAQNHPWAGRTALIVTQHGKDRAIAPALARLGINAALHPLDTDRFGTFSGEVPRAGSMIEAARRKLDAACAQTGADLLIASEGAFGPHPAMPMLASGTELIVLRDSHAGIEIAETAISGATNFAHLAVRPGEDVTAFLARTGFPHHALIVRANDGTAILARGVQDGAALPGLIVRAASASADGRARLETDMRAHLNPTRMVEIGKLAQRLVQRLGQLCPACGAPGFGRVEARRGLPCAACGAPTGLIAAEIFGCPACAYREVRPRRDGLAAAGPEHCPLCNP